MTIRNNSLRRLVCGVAIAFGFAFFATSNAEAFGWWRSHHSSGGSWGSYGGGWGSSGGSWGGYGSSGGYASHGGSWGSSGGWGLFNRWRARRVAYRGWGSHGSWGSSGGGSWGSSGGSWGGYSSHGSWGSSGGVSQSYAPVINGTDTYRMDGPPPPPSQPSDADGDDGTGDGDFGLQTGFSSASATSVAPTSAVLTVRVPDDAVVTVNGHRTKSIGDERRFASHGLRPGFRYRYEVTAEVIRDGQTIRDTKVVKLQSGQQTRLRFEFESDQDDAKVAGEIEPTRLVVTVPDNAVVYLAGSKTSSSGPVREFITDRLTDGQQWSDYPIRVVSNVDGQEIVREQRLTLRAGEDHEVAFSFEDTPKLASAQ